MPDAPRPRCLKPASIAASLIAIGAAAAVPGCSTAASGRGLSGDKPRAA